MEQQKFSQSYRVGENIKHGTPVARMFHSHYTAVIFYDYMLGILRGFLDLCEVFQEFEKKFNDAILAEQTFLLNMVILMVSYSIYLEQRVFLV